MNFLPKEIENIIWDYKFKMELIEDSDIYVQQNLNILLPEINTTTICSNLDKNGFTKEINFAINMYKLRYKFLYFTDKEAYLNIIKHINPYDIDWNFFSIGITPYNKIADFPIEFIKTFKKYISWDIVVQTQIDSLSSELLIEIADCFSSETVAAFFRNNEKKLEDFPFQFIHKIKDKIYWNFIGLGRDIDYMSKRSIHELPLEFVKEFKDLLNWNNIFLFYDYNSLSKEKQLLCPLKTSFERNKVYCNYCERKFPRDYWQNHLKTPIHIKNSSS